MESSLRIVAITNCPAGIAHTYMVAEALEQKARSLGHTIKVETQGSSGVENRLSSEEIAAADYVILATGRGLSGDDRARFAGKKVYEIAISQALKNIDQIFSELPTNSQLFAADSGVKLGKQEVQSGSVMSHLMAGVSAALPFVIGGGILVALANMLVQFGLPYTDMSKGAPSFTWVVESIGYLGFTFMIPIMGAYIASSIADKPAFAPAFLVCYLAPSRVRDSSARWCWGWRLAISSSGSVKSVLAKHYNRCSAPCLSHSLLCWFLACSLTTLSGR